MKIINNEEIIALGWNHIGSGVYKKEPNSDMEYWTTVKLRMWAGDSLIIAYRGDANESSENQVIFDGKIDNIEDLKTIMRLTHTD